MHSVNLVGKTPLTRSKTSFHTPNETRMLDKIKSISHSIKVLYLKRYTLSNDINIISHHVSQSYRKTSPRTTMSISTPTLLIGRLAF